MKATRAQIERAWGTADCRLVLLYGPDEAASRELAQALGRTLSGAERVELTGGELRSDPARLADEAASLSLFGDRRYIRVDATGDEALPAVDALLSAAAAGNPVVLVAGPLRKDSKLLKLALASPVSYVHASYLPEGGAADKLAASMALELGLRVRPDAAQRIAYAAGADRSVIARELEKFALFLDATSQSPAELDMGAIDALQADASEGDLSRFVDAVLLGRGAALETEAARLMASGTAAVPLVRALLRRLLLLAQLRSEVDAGSSPDVVVEGAGNSIFWKDRSTVLRQLKRWSAADLGVAIARMNGVERDAKSSGAVEVATLQDIVELAAATASRGA